MKVYTYMLPPPIQMWHGNDKLRFDKRFLQVVDYDGNIRWSIDLQTIREKGRYRDLAYVTMNSGRFYRSVRTAKAAGMRAWAAFKGVSK